MTAIRFRIAENPQLVDDRSGRRGGGAVADVYARLRALGVADRLARQWIAEHGEGGVADQLDWLAGQAGVSSPVRYLSAAIRGGWTDGASPAVAAGVARAGLRASGRTGARGGGSAGRREAAGSAAVQTARRQRRAGGAGAGAVEARSPTQRDADRRPVPGRVRDALDREDFARAGWRSGLNATAIAAFWEEMQPGAFGAGD